MRIEQQQVCVLHTRPYSESSLIVDLFSRRYGRFRVIAKGARRAKSYRRGLLLPFQELLAGWAGRGELQILTSVEQLGRSSQLSAAAISCGYYLNELMFRFLHLHDPHESLYDYYVKALSELAVEPAPQPILRIFEKQLLSETGFGLVLDHEVNTGASIEQHLVYVYLPEQGPVQAQSEHGRAGIAVSGTTLLALHEEQQLTSKMLLEAKRLLRIHLDLRLADRPLRSRRVLLSQDLLRRKLAALD